MEFGTNDKVKDWHKITKVEAEAYVEFLGEEMTRHESNAEDAEYAIWHTDKYATAQRKRALIGLWESAVRRHQKDIEEIDTLIKSVKHWHEL